MFKNVRNFFAPPTNLDDNRAYRAWLLNIILVPAILVTLIVAFIDPSLGSLRTLPAILIGIEILVFVLLRRKHVNAAAFIFVFSAWSTVAVMAYWLDGLSSAVLYFSIVILVLSGILIHERFAAGILLLSILMISAYLLLDQQGLLPESTNPTTSIRRWAAYLGAYLLVTILVSLTLSTNRRALQKAKENEASLAELNRELQDIRVNLEQRVQERTQALERRAIQLRAAAEVGHAAVSMTSLNELLTSVTELISERFGFYHAGIFLLDKQNEYAVLRAANSEGGQRMLACQHRLKVGETGIVGYVTQNRKARIALDVGKDATYFNNPDLPETRSEMALPLMVGERVLGALDVQSTQASAFSDEDIAAMQVLADQVAVAIQNTLLLAEHQAALDAARRAYREMSRKAWLELLQSRQTAGYLSTPQGTHELVGNMPPVLAEVQLKSEPAVIAETLAVPIKIRSNPTGVMRLKKSGGSSWSEKEVAFVQDLSDQLSQALEAARLYGETQQRAARERQTAEIVNLMRTSNDPQVIVQTAMAELRKALGARNARVRFEDGNAISLEENGENGKESTPKPMRQNRD